MADGRVIQPPLENSCLIAASMACLEVMQNVEVTDSVSLAYRGAVDAGLYGPTNDTEQAILNIMAYVGNRGVLAEGGRIHGATPYRVTVAEMIQALRDGLRPFVFWYDLAGGTTHAVAATAIMSDQLVLAEQEFETATTRLMPIDYALVEGLGAFAYASHSFVVDEPPVIVNGDWLPEGVIGDAFGEWREARKALHEDYTSAQDFLDHLAAIGADWTNPHAYGYPRFAPITTPEPTPTPEPAQPTSLLILQVWQQFDAARVASFCLDAGLNAVMVKALDGAWWMGNRYAGNPANVEALIAQRDFFHSVGLAYGCWVNPLHGEFEFLVEQAIQVAAAANNADFLALDSEPFDGFWGANRPEGRAAFFMKAVRERAPDATIYWQPDPRPARLAELRPAEWAPFVDGFMGQHYFLMFQTTPETEVANAVNRHAEWTPTGRLLPTFGLEGADAMAMERAGRAARGVGADGLVLYRYGLEHDLALAKAAVKGWSA